MKKRQKVMKKFFKRSGSKKLIPKYDDIIKVDLLEASKRAKLLLGIEKDKLFEHPTLIYALPAVLDKKVRANLIINKDRVRFDLAHFHALFFDTSTLYYYNTFIDHSDGSGFNDCAIELQYKEIKAIETSLKYTVVEGVPHNVFELVLKLNGLNDIVIPLKIMAYDHKTPEDAYLINQELLDIVTDIKTFLRSKLN